MIRPQKLGECLGALVVAAAVARAQNTWYVDASATPPGAGTSAQPYANLQYAHDQTATSDGDTLIVAPGDYVGQLYLRKQVLVRSALGAAETRIVANVPDYLVFLNTSGIDNSFTVLEGFELVGAGGNDLVRSQRGTIRRCLLRGTSTDTGVLCRADVFVDHCTITGCSIGLQAFIGYLDVRSTIVWDNESDFEVTLPFRLEYSCGFAGALPYIPAATLTGNLLQTDPLFVNDVAGDFRIAYGSPCIDTAEPLAPLDADGTRSDIGAFAFESGFGSFAFCAGDGTSTDHTTPCPCGNSGAPGRGCANSFVPAGSRLIATGTPAADDLVLHAANEPARSFTQFLQHSAPGDTIFHDGVLCAGGPLIRLRGRAAAAGSASFPNTAFAQDSTTTLAQRGGVTVGSATRRYYAAWYRNASTTFCPPATANVTNGWVVDW